MGVVRKVKKTWEIDYKMAECDTIGILLLGIHNDYEGLKKSLRDLKNSILSRRCTNWLVRTTICWL